MIYQFLDFMIPIAVLIFELSLKASLLALLIILIQRIFRYKLPSQWHYLLWFLIVLRLLLPFDLASQSSFFNLFNFSSSYVNEKLISLTAETSMQLVEDEKMTVSSADLNLDALPIFKHDKRPLSLLHVLTLIWISGIIIFSMIVCRSSRRVSKILKGKIQVEDKRIRRLFIHCIKKMHITSNIKLCESENIKIPFIAGLFRPSVIIPANSYNYLKPKQLFHIFLHELAHYKRYDIVMAWLTTILNIIHWFNPVIWVAFYLMRREREFACDTLALQFIKRDRHKEYGHSILLLLEKISYNFKTPLSIGLINSKSELSMRLKMLVGKNNIRKKWKFIFFCLFIPLIIMSFIKYVPDSQIKEGLSIELDHDNLSKYSVAIVAGHGGKDPGAIGINGVKEKDLNLSIAKKIQRNLNKTGMNVFAIRTADKFIPLKKITEIIDSIGTDIAIHVHCNYTPDNTNNGLTTYYGKNKPKSKTLDSLLHNQLITRTSLVDRGSFTAPFWVLNRSNIPSVLIQPGYISNKEDLRKLKNESVQDNIALAIKEALLEYFHTYNMQ